MPAPRASASPMSGVPGICGLTSCPIGVDSGGLEATEGYKPATDNGVFSFASHAAKVAVDPETGLVEILDYCIAEDCGRMVNPMIVEGQTYGGAAQGVGTALFEEAPYDENGQPLASTLMDYLLPGPTRIAALPHQSYRNAVAAHQLTASRASARAARSRQPVPS